MLMLKLLVCSVLFASVVVQGSERKSIDFSDVKRVSANQVTGHRLIYDSTIDNTNITAIKQSDGSLSENEKLNDQNNVSSNEQKVNNLKNSNPTTNSKCKCTIV
jgi:hypothetical protein